MTSCALAWSSHRSGAEACSSSSALSSAQLVEVEDGLDVAQGGVEVLELVGVSRQRSRQSSVLPPRAESGSAWAAGASIPVVRRRARRGRTFSQARAALW